jgi:hypothetical protein
MKLFGRRTVNCAKIPHYAYTWPLSASRRQQVTLEVAGSTVIKTIIMRSSIIPLFLFLTIEGFAQSELDYSKINFEFESERFELIKWEGIERNATVHTVSSTFKRNQNAAIIESGNEKYEFEIVESQFDGIDKTTFKCKDNTVIILIPGIYFSFTKDEDLDTEYYFGGLNK